MARSHARILTAIWQDDDFVSLSAEAQRMFFVLISQPKLSTCGVLDYMPSRLARTSRDSSADDVERAVAELEHRRFVIVDRDTDELLIRTFIRNDGVCHRWQMVVAVWSAWENVLSRRLRMAIVREAPTEAWETEKATPPAEALAMRLEPESQSDSDPLLLIPTPSPATFNLQPAVAPVETKSKPIANPPGTTLAVAVAPARRRNLVFDALLEVCGIEDARELGPNASAYGKSVNSIRKMAPDLTDDAALADEILIRATRYAIQMGDCRLTHTALVKHWPTLTAASEKLQSGKHRKAVGDVLDAETQAVIAKYATS